MFLTHGSSYICLLLHWYFSVSKNPYMRSENPERMYLMAWCYSCLLFFRFTIYSLFPSFNLSANRRRPKLFPNWKYMTKFLLMISKMVITFQKSLRGYTETPRRVLNLIKFILIITTPSQHRKLTTSAMLEMVRLNSNFLKILIQMMSWWE